MTITKFFVGILCTLLLVLTVPAQETNTTVQSSMLKGFYGESIVDEMWIPTGRKNVLDKWHPNTRGPDRIYRLSDGRLEIHEAKAYTDWAGKTSLKTKMQVNGRILDELSDDWIEEWIRRVEKNPLASQSERQCAQEVKESLRSGKLVRIFDEINLKTGEFRASTVYPDQSHSVRLEQRSGPIRIERHERKFLEAQKRLQELRLTDLEQKGIAKGGKLERLHSPPKAFKDFQSVADKRYNSARAVPGIILSDGRLVVSISEGASAGILVFAVEGGLATYHHMQGDTFKPEFEKQVKEAAIKGAAVGTGVGVAVLLGAGPSGWIVLGIGTGSYFVCDFAIQKYNERQESKMLNRADLAPFGIEIDSPLEPKLNTLPGF